DTVRIQYHGKDKEGTEIVFLKKDDLWYLEQNGKRARVEGFRIDDMVRSIKNAKASTEDEKVRTDTAEFDLPPGKPRMTVTLSGKVKNIDKKWEFFVGREGAGGGFVYVNSSDRSKRAFPVSKQAIEGILFKDTAALRSKRLFDLVEP